MSRFLYAVRLSGGCGQVFIMAAMQQIVFCLSGSLSHSKSIEFLGIHLWQAQFHEQQLSLLEAAEGTGSPRRCDHVSQ